MTTYKTIKNKKINSNNFFIKHKDQIILWFVFAIGILTSCCCRFTWNMAFTAFVFPGCILYFTRKAKATWGLPIAYLGLLFGCSISMYDMIIHDMGWGLGIGVNILVALFTFIPYLLDKLVFTRYFSNRPMMVALLLPLTWVTLDIIHGLTPIANYVSIAYSQIYFIQLVGVISLFGIHFLSFVILFFNSVIVGFFTFKKANIKAAIASFSLLAFSLVYGGIYSAVPLASNQTVKVMTAYSTNDNSEFGKRRQWSLEESKNWLLKDATAAKNNNTQMLVYSEEAFWITDENEQAFHNYAQTIARDNNLYLVLGLQIGGDNHEKEFHKNEAWVYNTKGERIVKYTKNHLVPITEKCFPGDGNIPVVDTEFGRLAIVICMDLEFPSFISKAGLQGADILIAPSWDWAGMPSGHSATTTFRAIENGVNFIRNTEEGYTIACDYRGKIIAEYYSNADIEQYKKTNHVFSLPTKGVATLYSYIGQGIHYVFPAGLVAICVACPIIDRKKKALAKAR